jgi:nitrite reductase/ring-hydroxylating ferredoxin subunit
MAFLFAARLEELSESRITGVNVLGYELILVRENGTVHALDGWCPHRNGPLSQGNYCGGNIICPWHAWEFRVSDGSLDFNPAIALRKYPVEIRGGEVFVDIPDAGTARG